jgi:hypothetical protein
MDALRDFPSTNTVLETEKGKAFHRKTDIFKRLVWYAFTVDEKREQTELIEGGVGGNWVVLSVDRVNEIISLNRKGVKPPDLRLPEEEDDLKIAEPDYENVVGQDRIDRMDKLKKKKKKKKRKPGAAEGQAEGGTQGPRPDNRGQQKPVQQNQQRPQQNQQKQNQQRQNKPQPNRPQQNSPRPQGSGQQNRPRPQNQQRRNDRSGPPDAANPS